MLLRVEGGAPSPTGSMAIHGKPPHPHPPTPPTASPHLRPTQSPSHRPLPWVWDTTPGHAAAAKRRAKLESSGVSFQDFSPHSFLLCACSGKRGRVTARNKSGDEGVYQQKCAPRVVKTTRGWGARLGSTRHSACLRNRQMHLGGVEVVLEHVVQASCAHRRTRWRHPRAQARCSGCHEQARCCGAAASISAAKP